MSFNQDYVMRLIEQLGHALGRIAALLLNRPPDPPAELETELNGLAHEAGLDLALARRLTPESLQIMIAPAGTINPGRCRFLAELLYLHGVQAEQSGRAGDARDSYVRSLHLYRLVRPKWEVDSILPKAADRIPDLEARLRRLAADS